MQFPPCGDGAEKRLKSSSADIRYLFLVLCLFFEIGLREYSDELIIISSGMISNQVTPRIPC